MRRSILIAVLLSASAAPAMGRGFFSPGGPLLMGNLDFLRDAPATYFDQADMALFRKTTTTALNEAKDSETRQWSNSDTGSSGSVTVVRTLPSSDSKCRELQITNRAAGRSHTERGVFCYDESKGRWTMRAGGK